MRWGGDGGCAPRPPIRPQPAPRRRVLTVVFLGLLLDLMAFTLLLPLLPGLLESHGRAQVSAPHAHPGPPTHPPTPRTSPARCPAPQDPLYGAWQRGVDWLATAIGMPAEKRYNSVLFGGEAWEGSGPRGWGLGTLLRAALSPGLIGSAFSLLQFLSAPLTGALSDCLGRRLVMLLSVVGPQPRGHGGQPPGEGALQSQRGGAAGDPRAESEVARLPGCQPQVTPLAPADRPGRILRSVGRLSELHCLPGLQGHRGCEQGERQPLHSHRR